LGFTLYDYTTLLHASSTLTLKHFPRFAMHTIIRYNKAHGASMNDLCMSKLHQSFRHDARYAGISSSVSPYLSIIPSKCVGVTVLQHAAAHTPSDVPNHAAQS